MNIHKIVALVAAAVPAIVFGQTQYLPDAVAARKAAEGIVASIAAGNPVGAWKQLRPLSVVPAGEFDVFEAQYGSQQAQLLQRFGPPVGYEFVKEENVGTTLLREQFIVRNEKVPTRWVFVFYRTEKGWVITDFKFDGNIQALFPTGA